MYPVFNPFIQISVIFFWARHCTTWWRTSSPRKNKYLTDGWDPKATWPLTWVNKTLGFYQESLAIRFPHMWSPTQDAWEDEEIPCKNRPESLPPLYRVLLTLLVAVMPAPFPFPKCIELITPAEQREEPSAENSCQAPPSFRSQSPNDLAEVPYSFLLVSTGSRFSIIWLTYVSVYCLPLSTRI